MEKPKKPIEKNRAYPEEHQPKKEKG